MKPLLCFALLSSAFATTKIVQISPTSTQAVIEVSTTQTGCTIRVSAGASFVTNIGDIVDNGNTEARSTTVGHSPGTVKFVIGLHKGDDLLQQNSPYWAGVTCAGDTEVSQVFQTRLRPWGNTSPITYPFNAAKFGNVDYPKLNYTIPDYQDSHIDPLTGFQFTRAIPLGILKGADQSYFFQTTSRAAIDINATGQWTPMANLLLNSTSTAPFATVTAAAGAGDPIFIPLSSNNISGSPSGGWNSGRGVLEDLAITVYCKSASTNDVTFTVQITTNGLVSGLVGSPVTSSTCPTSATQTLERLPQLHPNPPFRGWGLTDFPVPANLTQGSSGPVTCASSICTVVIASGTPANATSYFPINYPIGAPVYINGTVFHVNSIQSTRQFTTVEVANVTSVPWFSADFGIIVTHNGTGSALVSFGVDELGSLDASWDQNGDHGQHNLVPVSVGQNSDGTGPKVNGYMCVFGGSAGGVMIGMWVPYNADGSVRNETRVLSIMKIPTTAFATQLVTNGDTITTEQDLSAGKTWSTNGLGPGNIMYGAIANGRVYQLSYDETLHGGACANYPTYIPYGSSVGNTAIGENGGYNIQTNTVTIAGGTAVPLQPDCFHYTNLTPTSTTPPMDLLSQATRAWQTGLNQKGETVGTAHPGFDIGWLPYSGGGLPALSGGGFISIALFTQNLPGIVVGYNLTPDVSCNCLMLKYIKDSWGQDNDSPARFGGFHGTAAMTDTYLNASMNVLNGNSTTFVLGGPFKMTVNRVNQANYGAAPAFTAPGTGALLTTDVYNCPDSAHIYPLYASFAGTQNCVQVEVTSPPCSAVPNTSYSFPGALTEAQVFPCTMPGFGTSIAGRSKLVDMLNGDSYTVNGTNETFANVGPITYNSATSAYIWLLRNWGTVYQNPKWLVGGGTPTNLGNQFQLIASPGISAGIGSFQFNLAVPNQILTDNTQKSGCHAVAGTGFENGLYVWGNNCQFLVDGSTLAYAFSTNATATASINGPMFPLFPSNPGFNGGSLSANHGIGQTFFQSYPNGYHNFLANVAFPIQVDVRAINPAGGIGSESAQIAGGSASITLVGGTSHTYLITDVLSSAADYKRYLLYAWAGPYTFKDISSPTTGNVADLPNWSMCRANAANECMNGSSTGNYYVSLPSVDLTTTTALTNSYSSNNVALTQLTGVAGKAVFIAPRGNDPMAQFSIKTFASMLNQPGSQYDFGNCRLMPLADFVACAAMWVGGNRHQWLNYYLGTNYNADFANRTSFQNVQVTATPPPRADHAQIRFGYADYGNGISCQLCCKPRVEQCTTRFPGTDPYGFVGESGLSAGTSVTPGTPITMTIPAVSDNIMYAVIDWMIGTNVIQSSPTLVIPVP